MRSISYLILASLLLATVAFAGGGNILASGEIEIAACEDGSTNTQTVGLYNIAGKEWSRVHAIIVKNNTDFPTVTTLKRIDLDDTTTLATATAASNATTYAAAVSETYATTVTTNSVVTFRYAGTSVTNEYKVYSGTNDACIWTNTSITYGLGALTYVTNSVLTYKVLPTTTVAPCAKEVQISVAITTNDAASTLEYFIYGE